jgi:hypothetical protein
MFVLNTQGSQQGYAMKFANGWTLSVQFGYGNYCSRRNCAPLSTGPSNTAEVAAWDANRKGYVFDEDGRECLGWQTADQVVRWMNVIAGQPPAKAVA